MKIGEPEEKIWGQTVCTHQSLSYMRHELEMREGCYCSFHYHNNRANVFRVTAGVIRVVWAYGWYLYHRTLRAGEALEIPSLVPHQFQVLESGSAVEEYYPDRGGVVLHEDIERLTVGGEVLITADAHMFRHIPSVWPIVGRQEGTKWIIR